MQSCVRAMTLAPLVSVIIVATSTCGETGKWDDSPAPAQREEKLVAQRTLGGARKVTVLNLLSQRDPRTPGVVTYEIRGTDGGLQTQIWTKSVGAHEDYLHSWAIAVDEKDEVVGILVAGRIGAEFFEIRVANNKPQEPQLPPAIGAASRCRFGDSEKDRFPFREQLGRQFSLADIADAKLEARSGAWELRLRLRRPRLDKRGQFVNEPGIEHEIVDVLYTKPVGNRGAQWRSSVVKNETADDAQCYQTLKTIAACKDFFHKKYGGEDASSVDPKTFADEFFDGKSPKCPCGGAYDIGVIGVPPRCSVHGELEDREHFPRQGAKPGK